MAQAFLTVDQFANRLQVDSRVVAKMIRDGEIRTLKIGGIVRIPDTVIEELASTANTAKAGPKKAAKAPTEAQLQARANFTQMAKERQAKAAADRDKAASKSNGKKTESIEPPAEATGKKK